MDHRIISYVPVFLRVASPLRVHVVYNPYKNTQHHMSKEQLEEYTFRYQPIISLALGICHGTTVQSDQVDDAGQPQQSRGSELCRVVATNMLGNCGRLCS